MGVALNEGLNRIVKYIVREPRPDGGHSEHNVKYGWPSSHSQFMFFFVSYMVLFLYLRCAIVSSVVDLWYYIQFCPLMF